MIFYTIYLKNNYGGGTQVLNKISEVIDAKKIYLFDHSIFNFFKIIFELRNKKKVIKISSDPIVGIILFIFNIKFVRFIQGKDTIYFDKNYNKILNYIYKILYKLSFKQKVIYNSDFVKNWILKNFKNTNLIGKISPGTDYRFINCEKEYDYLYVYRKYGWKNTQMFTDNLSSFKSHEKIILINSDQLDLSHLKKYSGCQIIIPDKFVSTEELNNLFCKSRFFISTTIDEGFGMPAIEAMAAGCLPIVPDVGGTTDFCYDDVNSLTFKNNDKISFKNSIDKSRNLSSENYFKMINKALKESKKFSWDNTKQQTLYLKNKNFE